MRRPYEGTYPITREFGIYDPAYANYPDSKHPGTDYGLANGDALVAAISGTVHVIPRGNTTTGRGNEVWITNGNTQVRYCHLSSITVVEGQQVTEGQQVGACGWTGYVIPKSPAGAHLHFEVLISGVYVNPEEQYKGDAMTKNEAYTVVTGFYQWGTGAAPSPELGEYWANRLATTATGLDELYQAMKAEAEKNTSQEYTEVGVIDGNKMFRKG